MDTTQVEKYMRDRREHQKDIASHRSPDHKFEPGDYSKGFAKWAMSQAFYMFIEAVYEKAMLAREKYGFHELGWATPDWQAELQRGIAEHVQKGDPRDVAVYAMFAWFHGWSTAMPYTPLPVLAELAAMIASEQAAYGSGSITWAEMYNEAQIKAYKVLPELLDHIQELAQTNARLVDETHRWSAAVKKLEAERDRFQARVATWMQETFGPEVSADYQERGFRFGEEAIELLQANGTTKEDILKLVDYVYSRPVGELQQEVGGTMVTLAALCQARSINLAGAANDEQTRVEQPAVREKIQRKQEDKRARMIATPLPGQP